MNPMLLLEYAEARRLDVEHALRRCRPAENNLFRDRVGRALISIGEQLLVTRARDPETDRAAA